MKLSSAETELKLALSPSVAKAVFSLPVFLQHRSGKSKSQLLVTTYFETQEKDLARRGVTLRIRQADDERIQTVKSARASGVANSRGEWEWRVESATPDLRLLKSAPIADLFADVSEDRLEPVVVTDVTRTTQVLEVDGDIVEAALDLGSIIAGKAKQDICELELELREGTPLSLYRLALELNSAIPFDIEVESKAARGFRLKEGSPPQASKPSAMRLKPGDPAIEVLRAIVEETLGHLLTNQPAALAGDPEGVHQVRIAVRRIRSALRLFSPHLELHAMRLFEDELRHAGRTIGEARDWDVFCDEILPQVSESPKARKFAEMMRPAAEARRAAAHETCVRQLRDPSFRALVLGLAAWLEEGRKNSEQVGGKALKRDIEDIAEKLLDGLDAKTMKRGRAVRSDAEAAELHPLRKSLKKLRYSIEFLESIYRPKQVKLFLRRLRKLQDALGRDQRRRNGDATCRRPCGGQASRARPVRCGHLLEPGSVASGAMRALAKSWRAYSDEPRFWRRA